jgi:hypothetical protein
MVWRARLLWPSLPTSSARYVAAFSRLSARVGEDGHLLLSTRDVCTLRLLPGPALGHVSPNGHDALHVARWAPENGRGECNNDRSAILRERTTRLQHRLFRETALLHGTREACPMCWARGLWHDESEGVADGLCRAVPEKRLCSLVPHMDDPNTIRKDDGVRSVRNQRCFPSSSLHASEPFPVDERW